MTTTRRSSLALPSFTDPAEMLSPAPLVVRGSGPRLGEVDVRAAVLAPSRLVLDPRLAAACVALARLFAPFVAEELRASQAASGDAWLDQTCSPLGRRQHCTLARRGALAARKVGRRWLVRRADLDAFIAQQQSGAPPVSPRPSETKPPHDRGVCDLLAACGLAVAAPPAASPRQRPRPRPK